MHLNHPDDERLAALAGGELETLADAALVSHVASCPRCGPLVDDLRTLQSALAELPDVTPSRPLRFLPAVPEPASPRSRWLGILRGLTAPAMAVAVVMILVGVFGTTGGIGSLGSAGAAPYGNVGEDLQAGASAAAVDGRPLAGASGGSARQGPVATGSQNTGSLGETRSSASPSPILAPAAGGSASASASEKGAYFEGRTATAARLANEGDTGRAPFGWLLGAGVVLLGAAFLVRGYLRRRTLA